MIFGNNPIYNKMSTKKTRELIRCGSSIRRMSRIHIRTSWIHIRTPRVGLPKLAMSRRYYKIFLPNFFVSKKSTSHRPSGISSKSKSYFRRSSTYQLFKNKFGLETVFFLIFRFQDINKFPTSGNHKKNIFHFKPSGSHFKETLFQTSTPCRIPSRWLISWDFRPFYMSQALGTPGSF